MQHSDFLAAVARIERELGELIERTHAATPPTVEWVAMLAWAASARGCLMGLAELGIPDSNTALAPSPPPSPHAPPSPSNPRDRHGLECLFCTNLREPDSKFCERHKGGQPLDDD